MQKAGNQPLQSPRCAIAPMQPRVRQQGQAKTGASKQWHCASERRNHCECARSAGGWSPAGWSDSDFPSFLHPMFVAMVLSLSAVSGVLAFAFWFGIFRSIDIVEKKFDGGTLFYFDYRGHIKNVGSRFRSICADSSTIFGSIGKGASPTGIYCDDPNAIMDPNLLRACLGLIVKSDVLSPEIEKALTSRGYKKAYLPPANAFYGRFPARMQLSCVLGAMKFYPKLHKLVEDNQHNTTEMQQGVSIEVVEGGWIHYYFPLEKFSDFKLSPFPRPEQKLRTTAPAKKNE